MRLTIAVAGALALGVGAWVWLGRGDAAEAEAGARGAGRAGPPAPAQAEAGAAAQAAPAQAEAPPDELPAPPSDRLALLVGIDDYDGLDPLRGCVRDVQRAAALLQSRFGFAPGDVRTLTNREATHEAIVRAFDEHLLQRATPMSEVVFWFSGHGSRVPDVDDEEQELDGMDSSLLAWDSRASGPPGEYDLVDDELGALIRALAAITPRVVVVTDSCHSGGSVRGHADLKPRGIPMGERPLDPERLAAFWPAGVELAPGPLDGRDFVHLAACAPNQLAYEYTYEDDAGERVQQGLLSFFLTDALERCPPGTTWRRLADDVATRIQSHRPGQTVWAAGALERVVFEDRFEPRPPGYPGRTLLDTVLVEAGLVHGLDVGARLVVRPSLDPQGALGEIELRQVRATTASGRWLEVPEGLANDTPVRVEVTHHSLAREPLRVKVDGVDPALLPAELVELVDQADTAEVFLRLDEAGEVALFDYHGHRLWPREEIDHDLAQEVQEELLWRDLVGLGELPGELAVEVRLRECTEAERAEWGRPGTPVTTVPAEGEGRIAGVQYGALGGPDDTDFRLAMLEVTNRSAEPVHVVVVSVAEHRGCFPIYPSDTHPQANRLGPGETRTAVTGLVCPRSWELERPMRDRYVAIATREWVDVTVFGRQRVLRGGGDKRAGYPGAIGRALRSRPRTRGIATEPASDGGGWGVAILDVLVGRDY